MKEIDALEIFTKRPRVYAVFRITGKGHPLLKHGYRIGEEFLVSKDAVGFLMYGPLVPGTTSPTSGAARHNPGNFKGLAFMEYRITHGITQIWVGP